MKVCSLCRKSLPLTAFGKNKAKADGLVAYCKECRKVKSNTRYATDSVFREDKKEKTRKHNSQARLDPVIKERHATATKNWQDKTPGYGRAAAAAAKANKRLKTPSWSESREIAKFYRACPSGYEVDHIVPLNGEKFGVCGLHVLANLQYLTVKANAEKSNRWDWEKQV